MAFPLEIQGRPHMAGFWTFSWTKLARISGFLAPPGPLNFAPQFSRTFRDRKRAVFWKFLVEKHEKTRITAPETLLRRKLRPNTTHFSPTSRIIAPETLLKDFQGLQTRRVVKIPCR